MAEFNYYQTKMLADLARDIYRDSLPHSGLNNPNLHANIESRIEEMRKLWCAAAAMAKEIIPAP